jgi:hypothetical protein
MTILEEARHSLIVIEHDPLLYEDAQGMVEYVSKGLHDAAKEATFCFLLTWNRYYLVLHASERSSCQLGDDRNQLQE